MTIHVAVLVLSNALFNMLAASDRNQPSEIADHLGDNCIVF